MRSWAWACLACALPSLPSGPHTGPCPTDRRRSCCSWPSSRTSRRPVCWPRHTVRSAAGRVARSSAESCGTSPSASSPWASSTSPGCAASRASPNPAAKWSGAALEDASTSMSGGAAATSWWRSTARSTEPDSTSCSTTFARTLSSWRVIGCSASTSSDCVSKPSCSCSRSPRGTTPHAAGSMYLTVTRDRRIHRTAGSGVLEGVLAAEADPEGDPVDVDRAVVAGAHRQRQRLEDVLADATVLGQLDGVLPGEARGAQLVGGLVRRADHALLGDVAERVGADRGADLLDTEAGGDELGTRREVDAVEAGPLHRRRADAHVHRPRAGLAEHADLRSLGVAAHDRVVDDDEALAADRVLERVELEPDAELAQGLRRLDEGASDVGVLDEALAERDAALLRIPNSRRHARLGHPDDEVGVDGVLAREDAAHLDAGLVHDASADDGVGAGEVDVLEDAALGLGRRELVRAQAVLVDDDELAGLDLADDGRADRLQGCGLGRDDPATLEAAEREGTHAPRVAGGIQRRLVHEDEGERALELGQQLEGGLLGRAVLVGREQRRDERGVGGVAAGELAGDAGAAEVLVDEGLELDRVDEVAVVGQGQRAVAGAAKGRLRVLPRRAAGRGVAGVADRDVAAERAERGLVEDLRHEAHVLVDEDLLAVTGRDAGRLLPAVLQRIEPEVRQLRDVLSGSPDAEDPAGVLRAFLAGDEVMVQTTVATCHSASVAHAGGRLVRGSRPQRQLGEHLVARPPPPPLTEVGLDEREVVDPPGRPLPGVERADPTGRLGGVVEAAERQVRVEARPVGRRPRRRRRTAYAARHRSEVAADLLHPRPEHAGGVRVREGAGPGELQDEGIAPCCGAPERVGQVVEAGLRDGAEEGEGDVPLVAVGPADLRARLAPRLDVRLEVVEHVVGRDDGDEQPHGMEAAPEAMRASTSSMPHAARAARVSAPGVDGGAPSAAGVREKRGAGAGWTRPWCSTEVPRAAR